MSISRRALFGKLGGTLYRGIDSATSFCKLRGNPYIELVHWLHQLLQVSDNDLIRIVRHADIDRDAMERDIARALAALPSGASSLSDFSHHIELAIERAWVFASLELGDARIRGATLIATILDTAELRRVVLAISPQFGRIPLGDLATTLTSWSVGSPEDNDVSGEHEGFGNEVPGDASQAMKSPLGTASIEQYCQDMTARAQAGDRSAQFG